MNKPYVIIRLAGGLGNQLFMYAFGRAMAERNDVPLKIDSISGFIRDRTYKRSYLLDLILPPVQAASRWECRMFPFGRQLRKLERKLNALLPLEHRFYVEERTLAYDAEIKHLKIVRPTVFNGYWQTPRYFDDMRPTIQELVRFPEQLTWPLAEELAVIRRAKNPVCLAIRRYEEVPKPKPKLHILQLEYFLRAMALMESLVDDLHYFVFAQDMVWAKAHIRSRYPVTFASKKDLHAGAVQDLYLMSQCRHFIISNSTLHWWAVWLAQPEIVIAPSAGWSNDDLVQPNWIKII